MKHLDHILLGACILAFLLGSVQYVNQAYAQEHVVAESAESMHPIPMSLPTGIDIVQVVHAQDGTFLLSCSNGKILWAKRDGVHSWTVNWVARDWADLAQGNAWTLLTADREVWAYDSRKLIRVWE